MKKLKMQLFGSFFLSDGDVVLGEEEFRSNKLTRLLVYILINREKSLSHQKIIEALWGDNSRNPESALKNQIYLIRNALRVFGEEKYIQTLPNAYRWNREIEVETDYELFEEKVALLKSKNMSGTKKKTLCREIIACYKGNVADKIAGQSWIQARVTRYESMYVDAVKTLCAILEQEENWEELENLCNQILHIDSLDEDIHSWLMQSLQGQQKYDLALAQYEKANRYFYENIGIRHPKKIEQTYYQMISGTREGSLSLNDFLEDVREQKLPSGAYFCDYQIFRQIYRVESRKRERFDNIQHTILLTLGRKGRNEDADIAKGMIIQGMDILEQAICRCLRTGDVVSRFSSTQFVILVSRCTYEDGGQVAERIKKEFRRAYGKGSLDISYELAGLISPHLNIEREDTDRQVSSFSEKEE